MRPASSPPPEADLAVSQFQEHAPALTGTDVLDTIVIDNHGPVDATDVVLDYPIPPDALVQSATTDVGSCHQSDARISCTLPRVDVGGTAEVQIDELFPTTQITTVGEPTVTAAQLDPHPADNSTFTASAAPGETPGGPPSAPGPSSDLQVSSSADNPSPPIGTSFVYTIAVHNAGPGDLATVQLIGVLSTDVQVDALQHGPATCSSVLPLRCTIASLPAGATAQVELRLRPLRPGPLELTVAASGDRTDPNLANNTSHRLVLVGRGEAEVHLTDTVSPPFGVPGQSVQYGITVAVTGRTAALGLAVCDRLPRTLRLRSAPFARIQDAQACWRLTALGSGQRQTFLVNATVRSRAAAGTLLTDAASATGADVSRQIAHVGVRVLPPPSPCAIEARNPTPRARIAC